MDDKVIEELSAVLRKHSPNFFADSDGGIIHHDMKTGRIHMVEVRAFDVTETPHTTRPALTEVFDADAELRFRAVQAFMAAHPVIAPPTPIFYPSMSDV